MFSEKKSKKAKKKGVPEISAPSNFEHRVHTGYDPVQGGFVGLPTQWTGIVDPTANRPKPIVDPSMVTNFELERQKVFFFSFVYKRISESHQARIYVVHHRLMF